MSRKVDLAVAHIIELPAEDLMQCRDPVLRSARCSGQRTQSHGVVYQAFHAHGLSVPPVLVASTHPLRTALLMTGRLLSMVPRIVMRLPPKRRLLSPADRFAMDGKVASACHVEK